MQSFAEFETLCLGALQQERSELQGLQGKTEAQLSAWVEHLFRDYLGYSWRDFSRAEGAPIGGKGGKQLFPDLRIDILDNGLIFIECKRLGRLDGAKGPEELEDGASQLRSYIRAHLDRASVKPKTVLGVVTDGNRWWLTGLNKANEFHTIAEWAFLTDDPRLIAQRLWLLAKPALAQPTSALVEFLARRTLAQVLREKTGWLTKKVNEKLPDGAVSEELIGKWLRDAFSDQASPPAVKPKDPAPGPGPEPPPAPPPTGKLADLIAAGILTPPLRLFRRYKGNILEAKLLPNGAVEFRQHGYDSCSAAAEAARESITGQRMNTNGWTFWQYQAADGKTRTLDDARKQVARSGSKFAGEDQPERRRLRLKFWQGLLNRPKAKGTRHAGLTPVKYGWLAAGSGVRGVPFVYVVHQQNGRVEVWIDRGPGKAAENKEIFDRIHRHKEEIEGAFGAGLSWERLDDKQSCRVAYTVTGGGYRSNESKWPTIQDAMIDAMIRLQNALAPHLSGMPVEC